MSRMPSAKYVNKRQEKTNVTAREVGFCGKGEFYGDSGS